MADAVTAGAKWEDLFPGVASLDLTSQGVGPSLDLRLTKKEGIPVALVPTGTPEAGVIAIKRVDELGFYNLGLREVSEHVGLSQPKTLALIKYTRLQEDPDCFKIFRISTQPFKRYSQHAIKRLVEAAKTVDLDEVWQENKPAGRKGRDKR